MALTMAWDFFIGFSRSAAAGGRPGRAVAKSDMAGTPELEVVFCPDVLGAAMTRLSNGYTSRVKGELIVAGDL
jgi:hypothetical protein